MPPELYPHQEEAVSKLGNGKVLVGGVGTGKSITAVAYYVRNESPRDIYVITTAKKRKSLDWNKEFAAWAIGTEPDATVAGVLTVDSWNNIGKYTHVRDAFFIFDEQRAVGAGAWADALIKIARANRWIMLSATPGDTWLDFVPLFLANGLYKNRTAFIREHVEYNRFAKYPKVDRYHGERKLVRYKAELLVEMPYQRHTTRIIEEVCLAHDSETMERIVKGRWHIYEERPLRDAGELCGVARRLANSDPSRLAYVRSLMEKHPRLIVFYNFDYELEMLRTLATSSTTAESRKTSTRDEGSATTSSRTQSSTTQKRSEKRSTRATEQPSSSSDESSTASRSAGASDASTSEARTECLSSCTRTGRDRSNPCPHQQRVPTPTPACTCSLSSASPRSSTCSSCVSAAPARSTTSSRTTTTGSTTSASGSGSVTLATAGATSEWRATEATRSQTTSSSATSGQTSTPSSTPPPGPSPSSTRESSSDSSTSASGGCTTSSSSSETFAIAEWNGHKHQEIPETDRWVYLVQYTAGSEGWNCITTDTLVFYSLTYSYKMWHQAYGRIDRLNTPFSELYYYVLKSDSWIDQAVRRSLAEKKNFNENKYRFSDRSRAA